MGWTIFEIGVNAYQAFLMIAFLRSQMEAKAAVGCREALCFLAISGFFTLYLFWDISVTETMLFLFTFLYAISALGGKTSSGACSRRWSCAR